jgi:LmbE family N-acetylglucosaminyl deacetylase
VLKLSVRGAEHSLSSVLAIGAHADDIEIGCGGTILQLTDAHPELDVTWVVLSAEAERAEEVRRSASDFLNAASQRVVVADFRDSFFPYIGPEIKEFFELLKLDVSPDVVFTHYRSDLHQDHRLVSELTWNTFRDHLILEYEIPKYDGDFGSPNVFVHLTESVARRKIENLLLHFGSQRDKHWFTEDLFLSTLRLRGIESNSPTRYAEAFYGRKLVLDDWREP